MGIGNKGAAGGGGSEGGCSEAFEMWIGICEKYGGDGFELSRIASEEEKDGTAVWETKEEFMSGYMRFYTPPVYHVWIDGVNEVSTTSLIDAIGVWNKREEIRAARG